MRAFLVPVPEFWQLSVAAEDAYAIDTGIYRDNTDSRDTR